MVKGDDGDGGGGGERASGLRLGQEGEGLRERRHGWLGWAGLGVGERETQDSLTIGKERRSQGPRVAPARGAQGNPGTVRQPGTPSIQERQVRLGPSTVVVRPNCCDWEDHERIEAQSRC